MSRKTTKNTSFLLESLSMTKIAGSGSESESISQKHGSAGPDPDPYQNVMDPQYWLAALDTVSVFIKKKQVGTDAIGRVTRGSPIQNPA